MNENKRIDNLQIKIVNCVGAKAQHEKCVGTLQKQTMGIIFNIQNWRIHGQNRPVANLPVVDFRFQPREKFHHQSYWIRIFLFFYSVSWFSSLSSKSLNITVCKTVKASPLFHQADRLARNASDVSAADWRYQTQVKKYDIFLSVLLRLFSGLEILL